MSEQEEKINRILEKAKHDILSVLLEVGPPSSTPIAQPDGMVSHKAAAEYLGVTPRHLENLVKEGKVPQHKVGESRRYKLSEMDKATLTKPRLKAVI